MDESVGELTRFNELKRQVIKECIEVVRKTPTQHAYTTYDMGLIQSTIHLSVRELEKMLNETSTSK
jgi:hypothetical protein